MFVLEGQYCRGESFVLFVQGIVIVSRLVCVHKYRKFSDNLKDEF
jgi:hypothetical protein